MCKFLRYIYVDNTINWLFIATKIWHIGIFLLISILTNNSFHFCSFTWTTERGIKLFTWITLFYQVLYVEENSPLIYFVVGFCYLLSSPQTISHTFPKHSFNLLFITCMWCSKRLKHPAPRNQTGSEQISAVVPEIKLHRITVDTPQLIVIVQLTGCYQ